MTPATYLEIVAAVSGITQLAKTLGGGLFPVLGTGTAGRIIAALASFTGALLAHGGFDLPTFVAAFQVFLGSAGLYHTVTALPAGGASASVTMKLLPLLLLVNLGACVTTVPVADSPLSCSSAPAGVCQTGEGKICQGTVPYGNETRHVVITYCEQ